MSAQLSRERPMIDCIRRAAAGRDLSAAAIRGAVGAMIGAQATPAQIAALLVALSLKGETAEEIAGAAQAMRAHAVRVHTTRRPVMDVCGTGGDGSGTFNVSTAVAFVVAGAGVAVAKHGNRAMTGRCGSADVLEQLGVRVDAPPQVTSASLEQNGIAFIFAQKHHPALRCVAPIRREIGVPTLFNVLGPLSNPAGAQRQVIGVAQRRALRLVAEALARLDCERAAVVRGEDGMDELTLSGPSRIVEWTGKAVKEYVCDPQDLGFPRRRREAIAGGEAPRNATLVRGVLEARPGAHRDVVILNAGLALEIAGAAGNMSAGCELAKRSIDSGAALAKLEALVKATNA